MTKKEMMSIMRLLSALETTLFYSNRDQRSLGTIPDYLLEQIADSVAVLEREILK